MSRRPSTTTTPAFFRLRSWRYRAKALAVGLARDVTSTGRGGRPSLHTIPLCIVRHIVIHLALASGGLMVSLLQWRVGDILAGRQADIGGKAMCWLTNRVSSDKQTAIPATKRREGGRWERLWHEQQ